MAGLPEGELMSRAAEGLAHIAAARLVERDGRTVVALIGAGDNGGDSLYAAGLLSDTGFACAVVLLPESGGRDFMLWDCRPPSSPGPPCWSLPRTRAAARVVAEADLVLDGIVGIGGARPASGRGCLVDAIADERGSSPSTWRAVSTPTAEADDDAVWADETVTFGVPEAGAPASGGRGGTGRLTVVDIGLDSDDAPLRWSGSPTTTSPALARAGTRRRQVLPWRARRRGRGRVLSPALRCSPSTAAVEAGVGMVRYVGHADPDRSRARRRVPEAVSARVRSRPGSSARPRPAVRPVRRPRPSCGWRGGPRLGTCRGRRRGGLDLLTGRGWAPTLLTPHAGELARLLTRLGVNQPEQEQGTRTTAARRPGDPADRPVTRDDVERPSPVRHARLAAELTGATVLLKGATTLVVRPDGPVRCGLRPTPRPGWPRPGPATCSPGIAGTLLAAGLNPSTRARSRPGPWRRGGPRLRGGPAPRRRRGDGPTAPRPDPPRRPAAPGRGHCLRPAPPAP